MKKGDFVVAGAILLLAGAILLAGGLPGPQTARFARIAQANAVYTVDLAALTTAREYEIDGNGVHLVIEAERGRVRVKSSTCPDQICVRTGWLTRPGRAAACVPARVSVELAGEAETDVILR